GREDQVAGAGPRREVARRRAYVETIDHHPAPLAADDGVVPELRPQRARLVDLTAAEHTLVARRERLGARRRRTNDVDDDADVRRALLGGGVSDVHGHPGYASCE